MFPVQVSLFTSGGLMRKVQASETTRDGYVYGLSALLTFCSSIAMVNHSKFLETVNLVTWYMSWTHIFPH